MWNLRRRVFVFDSTGAGFSLVFRVQGPLKRLQGTRLNRNWIVSFNLNRKFVTSSLDIRGRRTPYVYYTVVFRAGG